MSLYDPRPPVDLAGDRSLWRDGIGPAAEVVRRVLRDGRAAAVVVTDGARGSVLFARDEEPLVVPAVTLAVRPVVDSNGAGDAYVAAYLFSWLGGRAHADAARAGAVAGAWACGSPGTHTGLVDESTLRGLLG